MEGSNLTSMFSHHGTTNIISKDWADHSSNTNIQDDSFLFFIQAMSYWLAPFQAVGGWISNLLNCLKPCLQYKAVEVTIGVISVILGLTDVATDWINWNNWKENPKLSDKKFYTSLLEHVTKYGTALFVCEVIFLIY